MPVYEAVLERARVVPGTRYLDAGCGSGLAARMAASRGARVCGIDAAEALLAVARGRTTEAGFSHADLEELPFQAETFDVVTGFNAFQYAGNPAVALAEARRVVRRGGTVAVAAWGDPDAMDAASIIAALGPLLPPPPPDTPGPFALSSEQALRKLAAEASLEPVELFDVDTSFVYPDAATALRGLNSSGVAARAIEMVGEHAVMAAHAQAIAPFRQPDGSYRIGATARCLLARR